MPTPVGVRRILAASGEIKEPSFRYCFYGFLLLYFSSVLYRQLQIHLFRLIREFVFSKY